MQILETPLPGTFIVEVAPHRDERGFFARTHDEAALVGRGLVGRFAQSSVSFNARRGTVRGMHYAVAPHAETKLVRCTAGAVHDVVVDLRPDSPTFRRSLGVALSAENHRALYIPAGLAHGFQALADATELLYMIDVPFEPSAARGLRWTDPAFDIAWPEPVTVISPRDLAFPDFQA
jgi:dTDP-4-dehydrorhamnose 3,5-epimerase